ncbi:Hypothetical predicted protein [Mytilus galloprovincialis]|uniref:Uncharacterized protein n=1 Tax=Mytilus galloprovincialis TaxID=29158 RepID=A0A8B6F1P8_MYTGA|nr:Hypothetical predicted protein [Mytilus galloprovincialis]
MAYPQQPPGQAIPDYEFIKTTLSALQQLNRDALEAMNNKDYEKALDAFTRSIPLGLQCYVPEQFGKLLSNRAFVYYSLGDYRRSLYDANQASLHYPGYFKNYLRQGFVYKKLNEPVNAVASFINAVNFCRQNSDLCSHGVAACYVELIKVLCEVEDIFDLDSKIIGAESGVVDAGNLTLKEIILYQLSSDDQCQWKAISYLLIGAVKGADSKLAGSCSDCNCSALSVLKLFTETIDSQKKEWGCKLAIKLLQNGASFQEFEIGRERYSLLR